VMPGGLPRTGTPPAEAPSTVTVRQMSGHAEEWRRRAWEERTGDSDQARSRTLRGWAIRGRGGERTVLRRHEVQKFRAKVIAKSGHSTAEKFSERLLSTAARTSAGSPELALIDGTAAVCVISAKDFLPLLDVVP
jgi:hypothetical protein